jgi:hypothetical protein
MPIESRREALQTLIDKFVTEEPSLKENALYQLILQQLF